MDEIVAETVKTRLPTPTTVVHVVSDPAIHLNLPVLWLLTFRIPIRMQLAASGVPISGNREQSGKTTWFPEN